MNKILGLLSNKKIRTILIVILVALISTCSISFGLNLGQAEVTSSSTTSVMSSSTIAPQSVTLSSISVERMPYKTSFTNLEGINTAGGQLKLTFSNGTTTIIDMNDNMVDYSTINLATLGSKSVTIRYQGLTTTYSINTIDYRVPVTNIVLNATSIELNQGSGYQIRASITPSNATNQGLVFTSSDPSIVSVDKFGYLIGLKPGLVTITVSVDNKQVNLQVTINEVKDPVSVTYLRDLIKTLQDKLNSLNPANYTPENYQLILDIYNQGIEDIYGSDAQSEALAKLQAAINDINKVKEIAILFESEPIDDAPAVDLRGEDWIPIATLEDLNTIRIPGINYTFAAGTIYALTTKSPGLSGRYYLVDNIDINSQVFIPIGLYFEDGALISSEPFNGEFDGNNFTISNLLISIQDNSLNNIGFFSVIDGGKISNLKILDANINQNKSTYYGDNVGILAGLITPDSTIQNVLVSGHVSGYDYVGGLTGAHAPINGDFSSTPFVFTKDANGLFNYTNELGLILPKNKTPDDWAILNPSKIALQDDSKYHINIAAEFNEIVYIDEINLLLFDHDSNYQLTQSMLASNGSNNYENFKLVPNNLIAIEAAFDRFGNDVTSQVISYNDGLWTDFADSTTDYLNEITINLGNLSNLEKIVLLVNGVANYDNRVVNSRSNIFFKDKNGDWIDGVILDQDLNRNNIIKPTAVPRLYYVDLTKAFTALNNHEEEYIVRIEFDRRAYDYFGISSQISNDYELLVLEPEQAKLGYRGFSKLSMIDNTYKTFDYYSVKRTPYQPYGFQSGYFTNYGNVLPLIENKDDMLSILRYGDLLELKFAANETSIDKIRSFAIHGAIWYKHAERETGRTVEPIPFNGMTSYPYSPNLYPENLVTYINEWNNRYYAPRSNNTIINSHFSGTIDGYTYLGGLIGFNAGNVIDSSSAGTIYGYSKLGGLIGMSMPENNQINNAIISKSFTTSNIVIIQDAYDVGGLIGLIERTDIDQSFATGKISRDESLDTIPIYSIGGLIGRATGPSINTITDSYSTVDFEILDSIFSPELTFLNEIGGLVGTAFNGSIINSFYFGNLEHIPPEPNDLKIGTLVGLHNYNDLFITNSYYLKDNTINTNINSVGLAIKALNSNTSAPIALNNFKITENFIGFDLSNTWEITNVSDYPTLKTNKLRNPFNP